MPQKVIIGFILFFIICLGIVLFFPFLIKEQIIRELQREAEDKIRADINFDDISVSSLRNFPHITVSFHDFNIIGREKFANDTLISAQKFNIAFELSDLLRSDNQYKIKKIHLDHPTIHLLRLQDGEANFDILRHADSTEQAPVASKLHLDIDAWEISNGMLRYEDRNESLLLALSGINHRGKGDFNKNITDLYLALAVDQMSCSYHQVSYLHKKRISADLLLELDLQNSKLTFKNHFFEINHFKFGFDGYLRLLPQGCEMDIRFGVKETSFKNFLSLLPGFYMKDFERMKTSGEFMCSGHVKGMYDPVAQQIPGFELDLKVKNGMFKYDHLAKSADNIQFHLQAKNLNGIPANTAIDVKSFSLNLDNNPVKGHLTWKGLSTCEIDAEINAAIDLAALEQVYPIENITLTGKLNSNIRVQGVYNKTAKTYPLIDAFITVDSASILTNAYPEPLSDIHLDAELINKTGDLKDTEIRLNRLSYTLEDDPVEIKGVISDLVNYKYDVDIKAVMDMDKLTNIFPVKNTSITGVFHADFNAKGQLTDFSKNGYENLNTEGFVYLRDVVYATSDKTSRIEVREAALSLFADKISIINFDGKIGRSNITFSGHLYDYMAYLADSSGVVSADMNVYADSVFYQDWSVSSPTDSTDAGTKAIIPSHIDLALRTDIKYVNYQSHELTQLQGQLTIAKNKLSLKELSFSIDETKFLINGLYKTGMNTSPVFEMDLDIKNLPITKAYHLLTNKKPDSLLSNNYSGTINTKYQLTGMLTAKNQLVMETLAGKGRVVIDVLEVKGMKVFHHVSNITRKEDLKAPMLRNIVMDTEIKGSKVIFRPFSFQINQFNADLEGSHTFNNNMNYVLRISVPPFHKIKVPFHIKGTTDKPIVKLGRGHENHDFSTW